jgi:hypothetical protein
MLYIMSIACAMHVGDNGINMDATRVLSGYPLEIPNEDFFQYGFWFDHRMAMRE